VVALSPQMTTDCGQLILWTCNLNLSYDPAKRWVAPAVQRGLINPGKRQISVPGGGSTLTHHQDSSEDFINNRGRRENVSRNPIAIKHG
jgi:hypothetical protein